MKGDRQVRVLLFLELGLALLIMSACTKPSLPDSIERRKIYFVASSYRSDQIWQTNADGTEPHLIYEIHASPDRPASVVLPQQELLLLEEFLASITPTLTSEQVYLLPGIRDMSLSPDGQRLAWVVGDFGCHTPGAQVGCFGAHRLVSFDIATKTKHTHWQATAHQTEMEPPFLVPGIVSIAWSPDSRYIAFGHESHRGIPCSPILRIVDIQAQDIREVGIGGNQLTWSPDGQHLASIDCGMEGIIIRIYDVESDAVQEFPIEHLDLLSHTISWSSQHNQIAFTAIPDTYGKSRRAKLYVLEPETGNIQELMGSESETYEAPQWSPDGRLIAVEARPNIDEFYTKLLILDPKSKVIVAQLSEERVHLSWQWSADSKSILVLLGNYTTPPALGIFSIETNTLARIPLPPSVEEELPDRVLQTSMYSFATIPGDNIILWISQPNW